VAFFTAAVNNTIGGTTAGAGNTIAFNTQDGVAVLSGTRNAILGNSIFSNTGLGIDLEPDGVTPNDPDNPDTPAIDPDADTGANNLQNFPDLDQGKLISTPNTFFRIEFFTNPECDPSANGEGKTFLSATTATTNNNGEATFVIPSGENLTATATDPNTNTSEFSKCGLSTGCPAPSVPGASQAQAATVNSLDQKIAARNTTIKITIRGEGFGSDAVPSFLQADGTADPKLTFSNLNVSCTKIEAELFVDPDAALGSRSLKVRSGGQDSAPLAEALNVIEIELKLHQGAIVSDLADRIANHPTVVRANVQNTTSQPGLTNGLTGLLYVFRAGAQIPGSPFRPIHPLPNLTARSGEDLLSNLLQPKMSYTNEERFGLRDSLNFYFGTGDSPQLTEGLFTFALAVSPTEPASLPPALNDLTQEQVRARHDFILVERAPQDTFVTTSPLRILVIADPRLNEQQANALFSKNQSSQQFLRGAFPVDGNQIRIQTLRLDKEFIDIDFLASFFTHVTAYRLLHRLTQVLEGINRLAPTPDRQYDRIVLLLKPEDVSTLSGKTWLGVTLRSVFPAAAVVGEEEPVLSHELGHTYGLGDTYPAQGILYRPQSGPNVRRDDALKEGNRVEAGAVRLVPIFDFITAAPRLGASASFTAPGIVDLNGPVMHFQKISFMGAGTVLDSWIDFVEWNHLLRKFRFPVGNGQFADVSNHSNTAVNASADLLTVGGLIDIAGSITEARVSRGAVFPDPIVPEPGDFAFELLNVQGQVLSATSFAVDFIQPHLGLVPATPFNVSTTFVAGTTQVRIRKGGTILFSRAISANRPNVQLLNPQGGETLGGPFTINWTASDPDADPLTYSIFYLRKGIDPIPLATNLTATSFEWNDPTQNGGGAGGKVVVVASDGVNEGAATSQPFTVNKRKPVVTILSPSDGSAVPAGTQIVFSGSGSDPEDGIIASESLSFRSSLDGDLGTGNTVVRALSEGSHTITFAAWTRMVMRQRQPLT